MEVISVETTAFKEIIEKLNRLENKFYELKAHADNYLRDRWLDNSEVMIILKVSKRTLQGYRDEGKIPYSQVGGKIYYRAADVEKFLYNGFHKIPGTKV